VLSEDVSTELRRSSCVLVIPVKVNGQCDCRLTPGVSCAAGRRLKGKGRRQEAAARQCACGRPIDREERWVSAIA
jgi:hypothetical protein